MWELTAPLFRVVLKNKHSVMAVPPDTSRVGSLL
jgi:hypothetical protein